MFFVFCYPWILFFFGLFGILFIRRYFFIILLSFELMLLGILLNFVLFSGLLDDISGFVYFFFVLLVAGVESAVGLSILLFFYMFNGNLIVNIACFLNG